MWEGVGDWTELQHIDPHSYGHNSVFSPSPGLLNRRSSLSGCWFSRQHLLSNWLELPVHRVISLFYAQSISSHNWPTEYATSRVFGMACFAGLEVNIQQLKEKMVSFYYLRTWTILVQMITYLNSVWRNNSKSKFPYSFWYRHAIDWENTFSY